jgi:hypothetical protein
VSPLWRDEIAIYLAPRKLALVRRARGIRPRVVASTELAVPAGAFGDVGPALGRLADVLTDPAWHGAAARAVVADHPWARYGIVPPGPSSLDADGRLAHARYVLGDAHGKAVADWAVTLSDTPPGLPCVACAMPASLKTGLEEVLARARLQLLSLQPQLIASFNTWRSRLPADHAWFVNVDGGALAAAHLSDGAWDRVHMARLSHDWLLELERLQAFGRISQVDGSPDRLFVDAPSWMHRGATANPGIEWLEEGGGDGSQAHELALLRRMYP